MPNYKEAALTGTTWTRCYEVQIQNSYAQTPQILFKEQQVTELSNGTINTQRGEVIAVPFDPATEIAVLDPATGLANGLTSTYGEVYRLLYSAYIAQAQARDAQ